MTWGHHKATAHRTSSCTTDSILMHADSPVLKG